MKPHAHRKCITKIIALFLRQHVFLLYIFIQKSCFNKFIQNNGLNKQR